MSNLTTIILIYDDYEIKLRISPNGDSGKMAITSQHILNKELTATINFTTIDDAVAKMIDKSKKFVEAVDLVKGLG